MRSMHITIGHSPNGKIYHSVVFLPNRTTKVATETITHRTINLDNEAEQGILLRNNRGIAYTKPYRIRQIIKWLE